MRCINNRRERICTTNGSPQDEAQGRVNQLVLDGEITNEMATSLMNDSDEARKIVRDLVDIATLLYYPRDKLMDQLEEEELTSKT